VASGAIPDAAAVVAAATVAVAAAP